MSPVTIIHLLETTDPFHVLEKEPARSQLQHSQSQMGGKNNNSLASTTGTFQGSRETPVPFLVKEE